MHISYHSKKIQKRILDFFGQLYIYFDSKLEAKLLILILASCLSSLIGLWDQDTQNLIAHDEALYAKRAKLMVESDNWLTPFTRPHHKTVGSYWLIATSFKLFGVNEFSARFPSALFSLLAVLTFFFISKNLFNENSAFVSSFSLISMPLWIQYSRTAGPDMPYVFFMLLALFFIVSPLPTFSRISSSHIKYFLSGTCLSLLFFLRSFMVIIPILAFLPYFFVKINSNPFNKLPPFIFGVLSGLVPTIISIFAAYQRYGISSISKLFVFAKNQSFGGDLLNGYIFYPSILTLVAFPVGIIAIFSLFITSKYLDLKRKLLIILPPLLMLLILCFISKTYTHYALILLPSLALTYSLLSYSYSQLPFKQARLISNFVSFLNIFSSIVLFLFSLLILFEKLKIEGIYTTALTSLILSALNFYAGISLLSSDRKYKSFMYNSVFTSISQLSAISFLFSIGIMGNPNKLFKQFISSPEINHIINEENISLTELQPKDRTLFKFYLPNSTYFYDSNNPKIYKSNYILVPYLHYRNDDNLRLQYNAINSLDYNNYVLLKRK